MKQFKIGLQVPAASEPAPAYYNQRGGEIRCVAIKDATLPSKTFYRTLCRDGSGGEWAKSQIENSSVWRPVPAGSKILFTF